jgi:DNA-binding NarL/FixJ family response regulator
VDDHAVFAESLEIALALEGFDARQVPLTPGGSRAQLLAAIRRLQPSIVLLDLDLGPLGDGVRLVQPLSQAGIATVVVTGSMRRDQWGACIARGARTVIPKLSPVTEIVSAIRRIHGGLPVMSAAERDEMLRAWRDHEAAERDARTRLERLTQREAEVLSMLMSGMQVSDIARERFVSESTVRTQVKSVLAKLQVSSQLTAVGLANRIGWRPPDAPETRRDDCGRVPSQRGRHSVHQR